MRNDEVTAKTPVALGVSAVGGGMDLAATKGSGGGGVQGLRFRVWKFRVWGLGSRARTLGGVMGFMGFMGFIGFVGCIGFMGLRGL